MHSSSLIILSGVLVAGFACQWIAWRVKLPSILFLLLTGIIAGPVLGWLRPNELFGELLEPFVSLAVAVILYEGSMTLKFAEIRGHGNVVRNLVSFGVLITWFVATLTARMFLGWDIYLAALFGAIVTVRFRISCAGRAYSSIRWVQYSRSSCSISLWSHKPRRPRASCFIRWA